MTLYLPQSDLSRSVPCSSNPQPFPHCTQDEVQGSQSGIQGPPSMNFIPSTTSASSFNSCLHHFPPKSHYFSVFLCLRLCLSGSHTLRTRDSLPFHALYSHVVFFYVFSQSVFLSDLPSHTPPFFFFTRLIKSHFLWGSLP